MDNKRDNRRKIGETLQRIRRTVAEKFGIQYEPKLAENYDKETLNRCDEELREIRKGKRIYMMQTSEDGWYEMEKRNSGKKLFHNELERADDLQGARP